MKKFITMILALAMVFALCACGSAKTTDSGELILGTSADYAPFEFMYPDESGSMTYGGIDVFAAEYIAESMGKTLKVENMSFDYLLASLQKGDYDMVMAAMEPTEERLNSADFSDPYYEVRQAVIMPAGKTISKLADLKGKSVGGQIGTTGIFVMQKANVGATIREYDDVGLAIQDMVAGRIDAVICDDPVAMYYMNKKAEYAKKLNVPLVTNDVEYYGFTIKKGRKDLAEKINKGLKIIRENGTEAKIKEKWMGAE